MLEEAVEGAPSQKIRRSLPLWLTHLSRGYLLAGRIGEAIPFAWRALEISQTRKERGHEAYALRVLGEIDRHRDPPEVERAADFCQQTVTLATALGMRPLQAHCCLGLGTLHAKIGRREQASAELSAAIELYRAMRVTFWLPQAEATLAQVEGQ